jgi:hypothetical protein
MIDDPLEIALEIQKERLRKRGWKIEGNRMIRIKEEDKK